MSFNQLNEYSSHAIVIGGSIAGLFSARVLAEHFDLITIVEADKLPEKPAVRKGVPQSVQPHILLAKGYRILTELFPEIRNELVNAGALLLDWGREFNYYKYDKWNASSNNPTDILSISCSRPLLEWAIRKQLKKVKNVCLLEQHQVRDILFDTEKQCVDGVVVESLNQKSQFKLRSSLVVDTSGKNSQTPNWLQRIGFTPPTESVVNPFLGYSTCKFKEPSNFDPLWKVMLISQNPPDNLRAGYLVRIENGELLATAGGYGRDYPPTNYEDYLNFMGSLPSNKISQVIREAEPISPIYCYKATSNRLRYYNKVKLPDGLICLGDAVCALCPIYGQGITVSALSSMTLKYWLEQRRNNKKLDYHEFQKQLMRIIFPFWFLAIRQDLLFPTTQRYGEFDFFSKAFGWYTSIIDSGASIDPIFYTTVIGIANSVVPLSELYNPVFLYKLSTSLLKHSCLVKD